MEADKKIRVAILGSGKVGTGVYKIIQNQKNAPDFRLKMIIKRITIHTTVLYNILHCNLGNRSFC